MANALDSYKIGPGFNPLLGAYSFRCFTHIIFVPLDSSVFNEYLAMLGNINIVGFSGRQILLLISQMQLRKTEKRQIYSKTGNKAQ